MMFLEMVRDLKAEARAVWPQPPTSRATRTCLTYPVTLHCNSSANATVTGTDARTALSMRHYF
jgi:hypothetical protein